MDNKEIIESLYQRILEVRRRIYVDIEDVFRLLCEEHLNRSAVARVLAHLKSDISVLVELLDSIKEYMNKVSAEVGYQEMFKQLPPVLAIIFAILIALAESARSLKYDLEQNATNLGYIADKLLRKYSFGDFVYSDDSIRVELYKEVSSLLERVKMLDVHVERELYRMGYATIRQVPMVSVVDLITFYVSDWPGLNDKWVCVAAYLAALEVVVNITCSEISINVDTFKKKLEKLVQYMRKHGIEVSMIEKDIVSRLYDYRNKVLHGGYIPTDDELNYVITVVPKFIQAVKEFRQRHKTS